MTVGSSDRDQTNAVSWTVLTADAGDGGRRLAAAALATASTDLLAIVSTATPDPGPVVERLSRRFEDRPELALATSIDEPGPDAARAAVRPELSRRLRTGADRGAVGGPIEAPVIVVRAAAARSAGGFDPTLPGFGWPDLVARLLRDGLAVDGVPRDLPFSDRLHAGLSPAERCRSEGRWLLSYGRAGPGPAPIPRSISARRYRRSVLVAATMERWRRALGGRGGVDDRVASATGAGRSDLTAIIADARRWWAGPAPHRSQSGIGRRADWRFLVPDRPRRLTLMVGQPGPAAAATDRWQWLVEDGWTRAVTTEATRGAPADVVHLCRGGDLEAAVASAGPDATVVIEQGRSPIARIGQTRILSRHGFEQLRRYLVTPDLDHPKRYVPIGRPGGLRWLLASPPAIGRPSRPSPQAAVDRICDRLVGALEASIVGPLTDVVAAALGHGTMVATRASTTDTVHDDHDDRILLTSGHDEGSRAVLLPLSGGRGVPGPVVKISARPRYNHNIDREVARVRSLRAIIAQSGSKSPTPRPITVDLLPDPGDPFDVGPLRALTESYAGRWSAADFCHRRPRTRDRVLELVIEMIDGLALSSVGATIDWSPASFDRYLGRLFDDYQRAVGSDAGLQRLRSRLLERSDALSGRSLPLVERHFDLGPWNVLFGADRLGVADVERATGSVDSITIVDWELGPLREAEPRGPAGADQLYFIKYWLHAAMEVRSIDDELAAFDFLAPGRQPGAGPGIDEPGSSHGDPRLRAGRVMRRSLDRLGVSGSFVPLLAAHVWLEAAIHTMHRRQGRGVEPGSPGLYLQSLARHADRLLEFWALDHG